MMTLASTTTNVTKRAQAENAWDELLRESLRRGFHGTVAIEVSVQDGTIQHIRRRIDRLEK
jgi:hypothetical protein